MGWGKRMQDAKVFTDFSSPPDIKLTINFWNKTNVIISQVLQILHLFNQKMAAALHNIMWKGYM